MNTFGNATSPRNGRYHGTYAWYENIEPGIRRHESVRILMQYTPDEDVLTSSISGGQPLAAAPRSRSRC
jgi:hypothetical protein